MADFSITKRIARLPCGGCRSNCSNDCVKCSFCNNWYHRKCQQISADEMKIWEKIVCVSCRTLDGIEFDYLMGMRRLKNAADTKVLAKLKTAVTRETLFDSRLQGYLQSCEPIQIRDNPISIWFIPRRGYTIM
ncbi:hypothetical protein ACJMK2_015337 [Sinanodonta woodiana]|uniref:PHD-type domain-containing protein n=1 Tax=Sinanodonta woodiana TaxID=1069815 RepID=A0ABD3UQA3_SINWO